MINREYPESWKKSPVFKADIRMHRVTLTHPDWKVWLRRYVTGPRTIDLQVESMLYGLLKSDALFQPHGKRLKVLLRNKAQRLLSEYDLTHYDTTFITKFIHDTIVYIVDFDKSHDITQALEQSKTISYVEA